MYNIFYKSSVKKDLKGISKEEKKKILNKIEKNLSRNPKIGTPFKGDFKELLRYRVGNYRVIYSIVKKSILILRIGHRKEIYK